MKNRAAPIAIIVILLVLTAVPAITVKGDFGGYICRFLIDAQFYHNQDITFKVKCFRTSADNKPMSEPVNITVIVGLERNGEVQTTETKLQTVIQSTISPRQLSIGKLGMGTWQIQVIFRFVDGHEEQTTQSFLVSHIPIKYNLIFMNGGKTIEFYTEESGYNFTLEVWLNYGREAELYLREYNVSQKTIKISESSVSVSVYVIDSYNWTNSEDVDHSYIYAANRDRQIYSYIAAIAVWIIGITFIVLFRLWYRKKIIGEDNNAPPPEYR